MTPRDRIRAGLDRDRSAEARWRALRRWVRERYDSCHYGHIEAYAAVLAEMSRLRRQRPPRDGKGEAPTT